VRVWWGRRVRRKAGAPGEDERQCSVQCIVSGWHRVKELWSLGKAANNWAYIKAPLKDIAGSWTSRWVEATSRSPPSIRSTMLAAAGELATADWGFGSGATRTTATAETMAHWRRCPSTTVMGAAPGVGPGLVAGGERPGPASQCVLVKSRLPNHGVAEGRATKIWEAPRAANALPRCRLAATFVGLCFYTVRVPMTWPKFLPISAADDQPMTSQIPRNYLRNTARNMSTPGMSACRG